MRKLLFLLFLLIATQAGAADYWCYIRTFDKPEVTAGETGGRSKKGDIVQVLDASIYKTPSETEKKEWLILKVSGLTETQINLMMKPWIDDTDKEKPISKAYRQYKLDLDTLKKKANIKIDTGEFKTKLIPSTVIPLINQKTAIDISWYKAQSYKYAFIDKSLLIVSNKIVPRAWGATTNTRTVIPAGGGDYASLSLWEDARDGDLVILDTIEIANCSGATADGTTVLIDGWITGASNYIEINGDAHTGVYDTNHYILTNYLQIGEDYVRVNGLQQGFAFVASASGIYITTTASVTTADIRISNGIIRATSVTGTYARGIRIRGGQNVYIWNTIIYGFNYASNYGIHLELSGITLNTYSVTVSTCTNGFFRVNGTWTAKNCYVHATTCYNSTITQTTCAASDNTATNAALDNIAYSTDNFVNVTAGSEDLHLVLGSALIDVGTDTSGESAPLNFTTDIDGQTRTGTWDIGADEYVAAGGWFQTDGIGVGIGVGIFR